MSSANRRAALGALDRARPLVAGLHRTRSNEELAGDIVRGWEHTEVALRALVGGSTLGGQALVKELRQRELVSLDLAHVLLNFHAAHDRVQLPGYQVSASDVAAAREAVAQLDELLGVAPTISATPTGEVRMPPAAPAGVAAGLPPTASPVPEETRRRSIPAPLVVGLLALVLVVIPFAIWGWTATRTGSARSIAAAERLYAEGRREQARLEFARIARARPELALPHVYLGRIARDQGEISIAQQELTEAIRREPENALAQREMGSLMLATDNPDLARRFYERAIRLDPNDRVAQGFMGCALTRLGRPDVAQRFLQRAGPGDWQVCAQQTMPGMVAPGGVPPQGYPPMYAPPGQPGAAMPPAYPQPPR